LGYFSDTCTNVLLKKLKKKNLGCKITFCEKISPKNIKILNLKKSPVYPRMARRAWVLHATCIVYKTVFTMFPPGRF
jgi:CO dehydrogenase/acetyl-CoA synthase alpha subunit